MLRYHLHRDQRQVRTYSWHLLNKMIIVIHLFILTIIIYIYNTPMANALLLNFNALTVAVMRPYRKRKKVIRCWIISQHAVILQRKKKVLILENFVYVNLRKNIAARKKTGGGGTPPPRPLWCVPAGSYSVNG